jgi:hypothetical protein
MIGLFFIDYGAYGSKDNAVEVEVPSVLEVSASGHADGYYKFRNRAGKTDLHSFWKHHRVSAF